MNSLARTPKSMAKLAHLLKENSTSIFFMEINYNYLICYVIILTAERLVVCFGVFVVFLLFFFYYVRCLMIWDFLVA